MGLHSKPFLKDTSFEISFGNKRMSCQIDMACAILQIFLSILAGLWEMSGDKKKGISVTGQNGNPGAGGCQYCALLWGQSCQTCRPWYNNQNKTRFMLFSRKKTEEREREFYKVKKNMWKVIWKRGEQSLLLTELCEIWAKNIINKSQLLGDKLEKCIFISFLPETLTLSCPTMSFWHVLISVFFWQFFLADIFTRENPFQVPSPLEKTRFKCRHH